MASTPPSAAATSAARQVAAGPSHVPAAAKSFTSPAPMAPMTKKVIQIPKPNARPPAARPSPGSHGSIHTEYASPVSASESTSTFGIRRDRTSVTHAITSSTENTHPAKNRKSDPEKAADWLIASDIHLTATCCGLQTGHQARFSTQPGSRWPILFDLAEHHRFIQLPPCNRRLPESACSPDSTSPAGS